MKTVPDGEARQDALGDINMARRTPVSRREFMKLAGLAGVTVGLGAGLGGLAAACGTESETTTSSGAATTGTTAPTVSTTVTSEAEAGREIKMGVVAPNTGGLAAFAGAQAYCIDRWKEVASDGLILGDGKKHQVTFVVRDSQSDTNRAAQVAGDLILNDKIDMMLVSSSPDTVNPVSDQCEALAVPCVAAFCPWQPYWYGRKAPAEGFKWTFLAGSSTESTVQNFMLIWQQLETNKKIGLLFANDTDGNSWADEKTGLPPILREAGYTVVMPSLYEAGSEDFTAQISQFKKEGCEICGGSMTPPDFTNFWSQGVQQSYKPKILTIGKALMFAQTLQAIGPIAYRASAEAAWHPSWPFKSSLTGETCQQMAEDYEKRTGNQWTQPIGTYGLFEWAVDVLKRTKTIDDKAAIVEAIKTTKLETINGPIDFTLPVKLGTVHPVVNCFRKSMASAQWVKGEKWPFDCLMLGSGSDPDLLAEAKLQPMQYS